MLNEYLRKSVLNTLVKLRRKIYDPLSPLFVMLGINHVFSTLYKTLRDTISNSETRGFDSFGEEVIIDHPTGYNTFIENKGEISKFVSESRPDDVFFDIGAAVGLFSCSVGVHLPHGEVHAFEPSYRIDTLQENFRMNEISGEIHHCAVGKEQSQISLTEDRIVSEDGNNSVDVISIDNFVNENRHPDMVKIDVEGAEIDVLQGMQQLLSEHPPRLLTVEIHPHLRDDVSETRAVELLTDYGYTCDIESDTGEIKTVIARNK